MKKENAKAAISVTEGLSQWHALLKDEDSLLGRPGAHHKALIKQAHELHRARVIDSNHLADLLEQADAALAYAVEALLDQQNVE